MPDPAPEPGTRCTLNGFLNNYVACLYQLSEAAAASDVAPAFSPEGVARGWEFLPSRRDNVLEIYDKETLPALESWYVPSLIEARDANALPALAEPLRRSREILVELREAARQAKDDYDKAYMTVEQQALDAQMELEALRPLILRETGGDEAPTESADRAGNPTFAFAPSVRKAWESYQRAIRLVPDLATENDKVAFAWIVENDKESGYCEIEFETWRRHLTTARGITGTSKYQRRAGRTGRSIVGPEELGRRDPNSQNG